jgi:hypothetical protein
VIPTVVVAAALGGLQGMLGARTNRVRTSDEWILWVVAGLAGGPLALTEWAGLLWLAGKVPGLSIPAVPAAMGILAVAGTLGAGLTPAFDDSGQPARWGASFVLKWIRSPLATTTGLLVTGSVKMRHKPVDFRRGMLFIEVGSGGSALALGAVAWCQNRCFGSDRCTTDPLARHEAVHSRTVASVGEFGFYLTYLTAGTVWGLRQGGKWNDLTRDGCGQPFEKTAHTFTGDPAVASRCSGSDRQRPEHPETLGPSHDLPA